MVFKFLIFFIFVLSLVSCGERTRLDVTLSGDDQESKGEAPQFSFLSGDLHYDQNSHLLSISSWINDRLAAKLMNYEYVIDLRSEQFVFLKNQSTSSEGQFTCLRRNLGLCIELDLTFPGLEKKVAAMLGQMDIDQTEMGLKNSSPVFLATWPRTTWKNNNFPWLHYVDLDANPIGTLELPNYNTENFLILPGTLNYDRDFYTWLCTTILLTETNFQVVCNFREKMTNLVTTKKWLIQFSF